ncbi:DUF4134 family protein [Chitinophaga sp. CC14]|uniref:DUF4134 family protein n=1 Tax=Chitinophaga sp. CC14 TaxID=3029199 RepID=UPI003B7B7E76
MKKCEVRNRAACLLTGSKRKGQALLLSVACLTLSKVAKCQEGAAGITNATNEVKKYFGIGTDLMYAVGAILGLIGAVKV